MTKILLLVTVSCYLYSCTPKNILAYKHLPFYREKDTYHLYSGIAIFRQAIFFDKPRSNDEEYSFGVTFMVTQDSLKSGKRYFEIEIDSVYYIHQIPNKSYSETRKSYRIKGSINFLYWDTTKAIIKQDLLVIDRFSRTVNRYHGKRRFVRSAGDLKLNFD